MASVTKQRLLAGLTHSLVDHTKLEIIHQDMFVIVDQQITGSGTQDGLQSDQGELRTHQLGQGYGRGVRVTGSVHQSVNTARGESEDDSDVVTAGAGVTRVPGVVLDTQHHWTLHFVLTTEVEVFRLEEVSSVGSAGTVIMIIGHFFIIITVVMVLVVGWISPEASLWRQGHHGVGRGASQH